MVCIIELILVNYLIQFDVTEAYVVPNASVFGKSSRHAVVGEVHCLGIEPELLECSHTSLGQHICRDDFPFTISDIAISCGMFFLFKSTRPDQF